MRVEGEWSSVSAMLQGGGPAGYQSPSGFSFAADCATNIQRRFNMAAAPEMKDHVYKILDLVGSSEKSIDDAIQNAITRASKTIREMKRFEVVQTRGHIENGVVRHYQVLLRVGFTLEE
jgi:dodecin